MESAEDLAVTLAPQSRSLAITETIRRPAPGVESARGPEATLPRLEVTSREPGAPRADLELVTLLGEGGMGAVWLARQRSLEREVAIKRLHGTGWAADDAAALLVEGRANGALEHPSIVPVHALGLAPDGSPLLVMKRVEGTSLAELIARADHPAWPELERRHGDRLAARLEILARVEASST